VAAGLLWGTGGLTGSLLGRGSGLPALSVAAYRLATGGALIIVVLVLAGRRWPAGRAAWTRITAIAGLAAVFQGCYFTAVSLTSVSLATLVTIGSAPVLVLAAERVRGQRRTGRLTGCATALALTGLGLLAGLPSGGFPETRVLASAGLAVLAAAGFAALTLISARPAAWSSCRWPRRAAGSASPRALSPSACSPRSVPARRPWPTRSTSAACGPPARASPRCCPCSSRSPAPSSRR
jgi:DME family drug/metabolite transporter